MKVTVKGVVLSSIAVAFGLVINYACIAAIKTNTQMADPSRMLKAGQVHIIENIKAGKGCLAPGAPSSFQGAHGVLSISGKHSNSKLNNSCPSGCQLNYTFDDSGYKKDFKDKVIVMDVLNNGVLSKNAKTELLDHQLPINLNTNHVKASDQCPT